MSYKHFCFKPNPSFITSSFICCSHLLKGTASPSFLLLFWFIHHVLARGIFLTQKSDHITSYILKPSNNFPLWPNLPWLIRSHMIFFLGPVCWASTILPFFLIPLVCQTSSRLKASTLAISSFGTFFCSYVCLLSSFFQSFFFFCHTTWHVGSEFPDQGPNLLPQWRKHGFLTTGASEKSPSCRHLNLNSRATFSERPCLIIIDKAFLFFPLIHPNASFDPYHSTDQYLKLHEVTFMCSFPCLLFSVP